MIKDNLYNIKTRIKEVCNKIKIDSEKIILIAVSKTKPLNVLQEAIDSGNIYFGENKANDLKAKRIYFDEKGYSDLKWNFIGHLQTNKAKEIVKYSDIFQCLDSIKLALKLDSLCKKSSKILEVYIQINSSDESVKSGISEDELFRFAEELSSFKNLEITGLMSIGRFNINPEDSRVEFKKMKKIFDDFKKYIEEKKLNNIETYSNFDLKYLSMGMTNDFEVAIEEGANVIRVGTAIFGTRE